MKLVTSDAAQMKGLSAMNWIPLAKRKPRFVRMRLYYGFKFSPVLFFVPGEGICAGRYLKPPKYAAWFESLQGLFFSEKDVTHWMPMPAPPKQRKNR